MLTWKLLSVQEVTDIYHKKMKKDFPPAELKPLKTILQLMEKGTYRSIGYYEDEELKGYSLLCHHRDETCALLDYLAVDSKSRGKGYGQQILEILREIYQDYDAILLEAENPDLAQDEQQLEERTRRIHFYEKCGTLYDGQTGKVFDVDYCIRQLPCKRVLSRQEQRDNMIEIYRDLVREPYFTQKVYIY